MKYPIALAALLLASAGHAGELELALIAPGLQGKTLYVAIHSSATDFPMRDDKAIRRSIVAAGDRTILSVRDIPSCTCAISVYADLNGNGKLDTNFIGIPSEPTGASRDAASRFGPPKFSDAAFDIGEGVTSHTIHIK
ncbi:MAG: DUF2141 domain-containing protein [Sideroxydans sp.]|nr:DUF2141 domain-containing protein [Sideroxydans sp.]